MRDNIASNSVLFSGYSFKVANIFTVTIVMLAFISFGSIGYSDARPQGSSTAHVNCRTIQRQIYAQAPISVCNKCTERIRAFAVCNTAVIVHDCRSTCKTTMTSFDFSTCYGKNLTCRFPTACH